MKNALPIHQWPIAKVSGIGAACRFDSDDLRVVYAQDDDAEAVQTDVLSACIDVWRLIGHPFALRHLVLQDHERSFVVSGHGNLVFQAPPSVNLGLLFQSLVDLPFNLPSTLSEEPELDDLSDRAVWRILARVARCEAPRRLQIEIGEDRVEIDAAAAAFDIVSGTKDLQSFVELLRAGVTAGASLRYTLGDPASNVPENYTITDVLAALGGQESVEANKWQSKPNAWPERFPPNARFDHLKAVMSLASSSVQDSMNGSAMTIQGYNETRRVVLRGRAEEDGKLKLATTL